MPIYSARNLISSLLELDAKAPLQECQSSWVLFHTQGMFLLVALEWWGNSWKQGDMQQQQSRGMCEAWAGCAGRQAGLLPGDGSPRLLLVAGLLDPILCPEKLVRSLGGEGRAEEEMPPGGRRKGVEEGVKCHLARSALKTFPLFCGFTMTCLDRPSFSFHWALDFTDILQSAIWCFSRTYRHFSSH